MAKNQKHYTSEFKQQILDLYNAGGTPYPQLERKYGGSAVVVKKYKHHANQGPSRMTRKTS